MTPKLAQIGLQLIDQRAEFHPRGKTEIVLLAAFVKALEDDARTTLAQESAPPREEDNA